MNTPAGVRQPIPKPNVKFSKSPSPGETPTTHQEGILFSIAFFNNKNDAKPKLGKGKASWKWKDRASWTWPEFVEIFRKPSVRADKDGPLFSPARFTEARRKNENVDSLSMLVLDFDHHITLAEALEVCEVLGVNYLIYTTHSHQRVTKSHPKQEDCFRVVIPLSQPIPREDFPYLFNWANNIFANKVDESRKDLCGMFYLPAVYSGDSPYEIFSRTDGGFLDWKEPVMEMKEKDSVGLAQGAEPPAPPTGASEVVCNVFLSQSPGEEKQTQHSSSAPVSRRRKSAEGASQKRLPPSLDSITYDPLKPFETWKAGLIVHISKHPLAKMNGQGKLDSPGLCHKSRIGKALFCNLDANNITCTAGCSVIEVATAYGYVPPPKSNGKEREVSNSKPKDSNTVQTQDNGDEYFYHEPLKLKRKIKVVEGNKKVNNNNSKLKDESPEVPPKPTVKSLPVKWLKDVEEKETEWLMPGVPIGKVTLIGVDPKAGKSWVTFSWAAAVSNGRYDQLPGWTERAPGKVLIFSLENDCSDTIKPRLRHLGAEMDNTGVIDTHVTLEGGSLSLIEATIAEVKPDLVIFDPITLYIGGELDMNKANKVRQPMQRLQTLAAKFHCAVVVVAHLNKGSGAKSIYRVLGSVDFIASVRSVFIAVVDPKNKGERGLYHEGGNNNKEIDPRGYSIVDTSDGVGVLVWTGAPEFSLESSLTNQTSSQTSEEDRKLAKLDALDFLTKFLADGPQEARYVVEVSKGAGISKRTLDRAKESLGIQSYKEGGGRYGEGSKWFWKLPDWESEDENVSNNSHQDCQIPDEGCQPPAVGNLDLNSSDKSIYINDLSQGCQPLKSGNLDYDFGNLDSGSSDQDPPQGYQSHSVDNLVVNDSNKSIYGNGLPQGAHPSKSEHVVGDIEHLVDVEGSKLEPDSNNFTPQEGPEPAPDDPQEEPLNRTPPHARYASSSIT